MGQTEQKRILHLLRFCQKHSRPAGDISFDNSGAIGVLAAAPYNAPARRHYFGEMQRQGLISRENDVDDIGIIFSFNVTDRGRAYLDENRWLRRQLESLADNVVTILVSVLIATFSALAVQWTVSLLGPQQQTPVDMAPKSRSQ